MFTICFISQGQCGFPLDEFEETTKPSLLTWNVSKLSRFIACGENFSSFIDSKGSVWTFGENKDGQLGIGKQTISEHQPQLVTAFSEKPVTFISCGSNHMAALSQTGLFFLL